MKTANLKKALYCVAHRGGMGYGAENSLPAIAHAVQLGVDSIEIDVWKVKDELFVIHDRRLGDRLPGEGLLINQDPAQLRAIELPGGTHIPTLREVLVLVKGKVAVNIELKGPDCALTVAAELESLVRDTGGNFDSYLVSSFDQQQLFTFQQRLPSVKRGVLIAGIPLDYARCCDALKAYSLHPDINCLNPALINDARRRGLKTIVYTVNAEEDMYNLADMGVDGVFTDYPEKVIALNLLTKCI